ncbi:MAG: PTPA-CTERM sorting domain-containing protein [Nodosilinea sp.]
MSRLTILSQSVIALGLASLGSLALKTPAQAFSFNTWTPYGDVTSSGNAATITNAVPNGTDDGGTIRNVSGNAPLDIFTLESNLGLISVLQSNPIEGSAIQISQLAQVGDNFSFNWFFTNYDPGSGSILPDRGFVAINNGVFPVVTYLTPASPSPFSYTFTTAGNYTISIGVFDQDDVANSSVLSLSNAQYTSASTTAVPTPALLPGLIGMGAAMLRRSRTKD